MLNATTFRNNISIEYVPGRENCSSFTAAQRSALNAPSIILGSVMVATQLFNLIIFHQWRNKEPYVLLHVSLAVTSLLLGVCSYFAILALFFPYWNDHIAQTTRLAVFLFRFFQILSLVNLLFISVDRWLSVEFPVPYRNRVTRRTMCLSMPVMLAVAVVMIVLDGVEYWQGLVVYCTRPAIQVMQLNGLFYFWRFLTGPLLLILLILCQTRKHYCCHWSEAKVNQCYFEYIVIWIIQQQSISCATTLR